MRVLLENVTVEEVQGDVSRKDASKYYGSFKAKYRDPDTKKKESIEIKCNDPLAISDLSRIEIEEMLVDIQADLQLGTYSSITFQQYYPAPDYPKQRYEETA